MMREFIREPRPFGVRRALFQIHLWAGLIVGLYLIVIGISGSILVFEDELDGIGRPALQAAPAPGVDLVAVADRVRAAVPGRTVYSVFAPTANKPVFRAYVQAPRGYAVIEADAATGQVIAHNSWLVWISNLHIYLLAGPTGLIANGIGAVCLLALVVSGLVIWWPGIRSWRRALAVDFRLSWRRISFDLHSAVGFWTLGLIAVWAVSGVYFAWPDAFVRGVQSVFAVSNGARPRFEIAASRGKRADLRAIVARAQALVPNGVLIGIGPSNAPNAPVVVDLARSEARSLLETDYLYFDPATGHHLATWHYGANRTLGDWVLWLMHPLHFGTEWGLAVKVLWCALGLSIPLLTVTGALMYWNRYLGVRWRRWVGVTSQ